MNKRERRYHGYKKQLVLIRRIEKSTKRINELMDIIWPQDAQKEYYKDAPLPIWFTHPSSEYRHD